MKYCFVFVCQGGAIEPQALLLAASLRHFLNCPAEIIACIPDYPEVKPPTNQAINFLHKLGIKTQTIVNEVDSSYLIANKIACLNTDTKAEQLIFMDSDMLCIREFHGSLRLEQSEFAARPTDFADLSTEEWLAIYRYNEWPDPEFKHHAMVSKQTIPLSFNAGFIAVKAPQQLHQAWTRWARKLNLPERFPKTRPFLDQISLPFAVMELAMDVNLLDQTYNFSSPIYPINPHQSPYFVHYYESLHFVGDQYLADVAKILLKKHPELKQLVQTDPFLALLTS